uniref:Uncharacterized protein n=1 Tax=Utricularia reniformis TaxID=192314 RepID=A0A1Y0B0Y5_9LAMI|nr:hypothetical protein AEK19_MT0838 [Utricularia reniformis]YP_009382299.1 hypothetical protein AEK19_MT1871 [Utricularia reniformis]ART31070.1 hypothetical protein AEK19_MT0838 [Utricularia reniformis]ART32041.1 hypothetical protein AEK19_MT1871 [Utricularia reniformis]
MTASCLSVQLISQATGISDLPSRTRPSHIRLSPLFFLRKAAMG